MTVISVSLGLNAPDYNKPWVHLTPKGLHAILEPEGGWVQPPGWRLGTSEHGLWAGMRSARGVSAPEIQVQRQDRACKAG